MKKKKKFILWFHAMDAICPPLSEEDINVKLAQISIFVNIATKKKEKNMDINLKL
jgi:hypothetical protein